MQQRGGPRTRSLTKRWPSALVLTMTWSTMPLSLLRRLVDTSFLVKRCAVPGASSASGDVLPMMTSSPLRAAAHRASMCSKECLTRAT